MKYTIIVEKTTGYVVFACRGERQAAHDPSKHDRVFLDEDDIPKMILRNLREGDYVNRGDNGFKYAAESGLSLPANFAISPRLTNKFQSQARKIHKKRTGQKVRREEIGFNVHSHPGLPPGQLNKLEKVKKDK